MQKKITLNNLILFFLLTAVTLSYSLKDYNFILIKEVILIAGLLLFLITVFFKRNNNFNIGKDIVYPFLLILWIAFSIILSKYKYTGIPVLLISLVCFTFLSVIVHLDFDAEDVSDIIILSFIPSLFIGVLQFFLPKKWEIFLVFGNRIPSTFGNPNFFGAYIATVCPFVISRFLNCKNSYYKLFLFFVFITMVFLIFSTGSKASLIAFFTGIIILILLNYKDKIMANRFLVIIFFIFFVSFISIYTLIFLSSSNDSIFFRKQVWWGTIRMILDHPVTGTGPGTFFIFFPQYRPPELMKWTYEHSYEVLYPENIFLQIGAETGITGILLFVFFVFIIFKYGIKFSPQYLSGFAGLLTVNFFGVDINYAPSMLLFVLIAGMILKEDHNYFSFENKNFYTKLLIFLTFIFLIFVSVFWIKRHISGIYTKNGVYFSRTGNFKTAIENYNMALKYYSKNLEAIYFLGSSYYDSGDSEKALKIFKYLEKFAPDYVLLHYKIAKILNESGLYDDAIVEYEKILKIDPYLKEALVELSYIYYNKKNKYDEAEKYLLMALEKYKDDSDLYSNLGNIYFKSNKLKESIECFKKAIEIKEGKDYYYNLGCVYLVMKDIKAAKFYLKKAEQLDPSDKKIKDVLRMIEK